MNQTIGSCSLCGGDVVGWVGVWHGVTPPPPARCVSCGAVEARGPVIPMRPAAPFARPQPTPTWPPPQQPPTTFGSGGVTS